MSESRQEVSEKETPKDGVKQDSLQVDRIDLLGDRSNKGSSLAKNDVSLPGLAIDGADERTRSVRTGDAVRPSDAPCPGDPAQNKSEKSEAKAEKELKFSMGTTPEREKLLGVIQNSSDISDKEKNEMIRDMKGFESRAARDGLSKSEVLGVYSNVSRLLEAKGNQPLTRENRVVLAEQVLDQAAHPMSIDQGYHMTCNVTTIECRTYAKYPSSAAKLVTDVALTGVFETRNPRDNDVRLDRESLRPDREAQLNPPRDGSRSYASQIFQLTAANIAWQRRSFDPNGNTVARGDLKYVQVSPINREDTGERVRNANGETIRIKDEDGKVSKITDPSLDAGALVSINKEITRRDEENFIIQNHAAGGEPFVAGIGSENDLAEVLVKEKAQYPLIVVVHTYHDPFWKDSGGGVKGGAGGEQGGWHVVNVTGYNAQTGDVTVSNQWGDRTDKKVSLSTLYKATMPPPEPAKKAK